MTSPVPADLEAWLRDTLVPRWVGRAVVPGRAGYVEVLAPDGRPDLRPRQTTLVAARLLYVFSHGYLLDQRQVTLAAARHGLAFLLERCRRPDGAFRHAVGGEGAPGDDRVDLYDLAFVLFGLAWHHRATGEPGLLATAEEVARFVETRMGHPAGGFAEDDRGSLPRRQNPHMHLLEAFHALAEASGEVRWLDRADRIVRLLRDRLLDTHTGTLGEFFTQDWQPRAGAEGALREPGHHFEWVWLLHHHERLTGDPMVRGLADGLYASGIGHGLSVLPDGSPVALDGVDRDGAPVARTALLWPQTEALKAFGARAEFAGEAGAGERHDRHLETIFRHYVEPASGLWRNQLAASGEPVRAEVPVRVLYHLVLALAETARLRAAGVLPA